MNKKKKGGSEGEEDPSKSSDHKSDDTVNNVDKPSKKWNVKTERISLRFGHSELADIHRKVKDLQTDRTKYLKAKINNGKIKVSYIDKTFEKTHYELNKLGNNMNQIARYFNERKDSGTASIANILRQNLEELKIIIHQIEAFIEKKSGE